MAAGRPPTPTAIKRLTGTLRPDRENRSEPTPPPARPTCPAWLSAEAKREWRRLVPALERVGLLTQLDRAVLAGYCQSWARWQEAERTLAEHGTTFETTTAQGSVMVRPRPEVAIAASALAAMQRCMAELGLTPASRGRLHTSPPAERDEFEEFLSAGPGS